MTMGKVSITGISGWKDYITRLELNGVDVRNTLEAEIPVGDELKVTVDGNLGTEWSKLHDQGCFTAQWGSERDVSTFKGRGPDFAAKLDNLGVMPDYDITIAVKMWGNHDFNEPWTW